MVLLKSLAIWLVLMLAETLHGTARTLWLAPQIGDRRARQISVFTGSMLILAITILFAPWLQTSQIPQLLGIGVLWTILTVMFEIGLGRSILHYSWAQILSDYNLRQGGLMAIGLVILTLSPLLAAMARGIA